MYEIHIDVNQIELIDKGTYFALSIPNKVYSSTHPPLHPTTKHSPLKQQQRQKQKNNNQIYGSLSNNNISKKLQPTIPYILKINNNKNPNQIQTCLQKLQKRYQELLRSNFSDQNQQAHKDMINKSLREEVDVHVERYRKDEIQAGNTSTQNNTNQSRQQIPKNNVFSNPPLKSPNQNNYSNNTNTFNNSNNNNITNPFTKNSINQFNSNPQANISSPNNSYNNSSSSSNPKNIFQTSSSNSLYSSNNQPAYNHMSNNNNNNSSNILPNNFSLAQNSQNNNYRSMSNSPNTFTDQRGNDNDNSSLLFGGMNSNRGSNRSTSKIKKGPTFA